MKKTIISKIIILAIAIFTLLTTITYGQTLTLKIKTDKKDINKGERFKMTIEWSEEMQAADFIVNYDDNILKIIGADIEEDYYNCENNQIKIAWLDPTLMTTRTHIEFEVEAINSGKVKFSTEVLGGFADKELNIPTNYENGELDVEVTNGDNILLYIALGILIFVILYIIRLKLKSRK